MPAQFCQNAYYTTTTTSNVYVPQNWNTTSYTQSYTLTNSPQVIWTNWNATVVPQYYSNDEIWGQWVVMGQQTMTYQTSYQPRPMTPEEAADEQRRQEQRRLARERELEERQVACVRARTLLEGFLDDEQKVELERMGRFHITGSRGRRYCIRATGQSGNVDLLKDDGSLQAQLCAHPRGYLPDGDAWLMQMIEIRHDEDHFLRTANVHRGTLPVAA